MLSIFTRRSGLYSRVVFLVLFCLRLPQLYHLVKIGLILRITVVGVVPLKQVDLIVRGVGGVLIVVVSQLEQRDSLRVLIEEGRLRQVQTLLGLREIFRHHFF